MKPGAPPPRVHDLQLPYFLDSCFLCHAKLTPKTDIYMYRGDTAFCSQECRQEQIEVDEATNRKHKLSSSSSSSAAASASNRASSRIQKKDGDRKKSVRTGTVAVA